MNSELTREWRKWHNISVYETGRPPHHLQPGARRRPGQRPGLHRQQRLPRRHAPGRAHLLPRAIEHPHRVLGRDPQIDTGQPPDRHLAGPVHLYIHGHLPQTFLLRLRLRVPQAATHRPRSQGQEPSYGSHSCAANGTPRTRQRSTSLIRVIRGQARGGNQISEAPHGPSCPCFPSVRVSSPPTGLTGMLMQPWNPWSDQAPEFLTCARVRSWCWRGCRQAPGLTACRAGLFTTL